MVALSDDQTIAVSALLHWFEKNSKTKKYISLGGYAGTGKTTIISVLRNDLLTINKKLRVAFVSYTGKATRVLESRLSEGKIILTTDSVSTIHALIYTPIVNEKEDIIGWKKKEKIDYDLIIMDEASMVDGIIWNDLISFSIPIIAVGDHGQLPPIQGNFSLMAHPELFLTHIHRQAEKNPIIGLSIHAREHGYIRPGNYSPLVKKYTPADPDFHMEVVEALENYDNDTLVLCGYNSTRKRLNRSIRNSLGFDMPEPTSGDRVICLRNNHEHQIYNGMLGTVHKIKPAGDNWYEAEIQMDDADIYNGHISREQFDSDIALNFTDKRSKIMAGDLFDFGYALTVHKAQGGQAKKVVLFEERFKKMSDLQWKRWLYTAVTRAEEELIIFGT
ncbi:hypothetical protein COV49_03035 [Candidatus Falkowbacteria bacterium CG11_big_fil_rev_8_21_14_0_20_39_10]|uniref:UvrD-like helicase C-terminal domain-containing protein n=1 Tax=Candidatus Falkowbacteria bacterium CG11_big_fil_rev_8_21_14_0_20_39_10 TaxID=1974570 RepID=A0A2M6K8Q8_9BACT|nr:MAG: hypothetical protein COV49_03035 [Candidatus Falkowbacteria bacterium CG11_big_fil_rev_8_21_14_0_20_39_10]